MYIILKYNISLIVTHYAHICIHIDIYGRTYIYVCIYIHNIVFTVYALAHRDTIILL